HRHVYGEQWIKFMKDGVNATPLRTVNTTGYIDHAAFLDTINPDTNKIPKHLFQGYLNIYRVVFNRPINILCRVSLFLSMALCLLLRLFVFRLLRLNRFSTLTLKVLSLIPILLATLFCIATCRRVKFL